jgi:hypothetical protein
LAELLVGVAGEGVVDGGDEGGSICERELLWASPNGEAEERWRVLEDRAEVDIAAWRSRRVGAVAGDTGGGHGDDAEVGSGGLAVGLDLGWGLWVRGFLLLGKIGYLYKS